MALNFLATAVTMKLHNMEIFRPTEFPNMKESDMPVLIVLNVTIKLQELSGV